MAIRILPVAKDKKNPTQLDLDKTEQFIDSYN